MKYIKGLVSVIIPTYKRTDTLLKAIDTVLNQTYNNLELILVNDNEKGDSYSLALYETIKSIDDKRFIFVEQEKHKNGAVARNCGIRIARGEYIAFQDDDDYWEPNKLEHQVKILSSLDDSWGAVSCLKKLYRNKEYVFGSLPYKSGNILFNLLDTEISLGTGATLIRHEALDDSGYFDESLLRHQDYQLFVRLGSKYKIQLERVYLQNREIADDRNRPSAEKLKLVKQAYFNSIGDLIDIYPKRKQRIIYLMHETEIANMYWKEKNYSEFVKILCKLLLSPSAFFLTCKKELGRIVGRKFKHFLAKKYRP